MQTPGVLKSDSKMQTSSLPNARTKFVTTLQSSKLSYHNDVEQQA